MLNGLRYENGERVRDVGAYVCKYLTKEAELEWGSRCFNCSKELVRPIDYTLKSFGDNEVGYFHDPDDPYFKITSAIEKNVKTTFNDSIVVQYESNGSQITQIIDYQQGTILPDKEVVNLK